MGFLDRKTGVIGVFRQFAVRIAGGPVPHLRPTPGTNPGASRYTSTAAPHDPSAEVTNGSLAAAQIRGAQGKAATAWLMKALQEQPTIDTTTQAGTLVSAVLRVLREQKPTALQKPWGVDFFSQAGGSYRVEFFPLDYARENDPVMRIYGGSGAQPGYAVQFPKESVGVWVDGQHAGSFFEVLQAAGITPVSAR